MTFSERAIEAAAVPQLRAQPLSLGAYALSMSNPDAKTLASACLTAALAVDGLVLVPREPTEEMLDAGACYEFQDRHIVDDGDISRDVYRAMLSAAPTGTGWQTIDSAPKDGGHVMLGMADEQYVAEGYFDVDTERWFSANTHSTDYIDRGLYPTHWMPLPAAPTGTEG